MSGKQILMQEIDSLPPNFIDDVRQYVSFLKFKAKTPGGTRQAQQVLWEEVEGLYGIVRSDINEKAELAEARDEKYARFG